MAVTKPKLNFWLVLYTVSPSFVFLNLACHHGWTSAVFQRNPAPAQRTTSSHSVRRQRAGSVGQCQNVRKRVTTWW